jgi:hypothetical protein
MEKRGKEPRLSCHKVSKIHPLFLELPWHPTLKPSQPISMATLLQYIDDLLMAGPTQEDCMEGTCLLFSLLWETRYRVSRKRPKFAKTLSNTSAFTYPRGNTGLALRENRLSVASQPLRSESKLESFWEL